MQRKGKTSAGKFLHGTENIILERPRLNALFEEALENPVVLVTAGEGYGKTQGVYSFMGRRNETAIWIYLSERDNDPWHFWENVTKAVSLHDRTAGMILEETGFPETQGQMVRCLSALEGPDLDEKRYVIVADDCHLVQNDSIINFVNRLLALPFPKITSILIYRTESRLNTVSLLSKGLLTRITADDLRFNEEEVAGYFRLRNIPLSASERNEILADTEGWALAISLIGEEMKKNNRNYSSALLEDGSFKMMEEGLFASLSPSLRRFLVILSLFEQWPLDGLEKIAAALPGGNILMEELGESLNNLSSLVHYDAYLHGFRIHRLFLNYLREKQNELSPAEIKTACTIAAQWCEANNLRLDAAINYGKAGDYDGLLRIVYSFPRLMSGQAAASLLEIVDNVIISEGRNEKDEGFLLLRHVTRAGLLVNLGRYEESREALNKSIAEFEALPPSRLSSWILSACYNTLGPMALITCRMTGDTEGILEYFQRGNYYYMRHPYRIMSPGTSASAGSYVNLVGHPPEKGEFENFFSIIAKTIPHASNSMGGFLSGTESLCRAELAFFRGDLNTSEQYARRAVIRAHEKRQYEIESKGLFYLLRIHLSSGNTLAVQEVWEQMEGLLEIGDYINRYVIHDIMAGWFYAHIGESERIAPWLRNVSEESDLNLMFHNFETMVKAKSLFAEKKYPETLKFLGRKEVREGLGSFHLGLLEITILKMAVHNRMGDAEEALKVLKIAYEMAATNSLEMPFIELGEDMRALAETALNSSECAVPRTWLEAIRKKSSVYAKKLNTVTERRFNGANRGETPYFSPRELSILAGISRGYTREEIAYDMSLSIYTVKNLIRTIYAKLGAFNRADAIRIAAGMGLLNLI